MLVVVVLIAAAGYVRTLPTERGTIDIYSRRLSDLPDLAGLTHQQAIGRVLREIPGKLLGVRLREQNQTLVYEVEWVSAQGNTVWVSLIDTGKRHRAFAARNPGHALCRYAMTALPGRQWG